MSGKMERLTWFELFETLEGNGLIITDWDEVNNTLDALGTNLDEYIDKIEMLV